MTTAALATLMIGLFAWLRADIMAMRKELRTEFAEQIKALRDETTEQIKALRDEIAEQIKALRDEIALLAQDMGRLRERMAHLESLLKGLRETIFANRAA